MRVPGILSLAVQDVQHVHRRGAALDGLLWEYVMRVNVQGSNLELRPHLLQGGKVL